MEYVQQERAARHQMDQDVQERIGKRCLDMGPEEGDRNKRQKGTQEVISPGPSTKTPQRPEPRSRQIPENTEARP